MRHTNPVKFWLLVALASFVALIAVSGIVSALSPAKVAPKASTSTAPVRATPKATPTTAPPKASTTAKATPTTAPTPKATPTTAAPAAGPSCAQQVKTWLAAPASGAYVPADTNQQVISSIIFDASAYQKYSPGDPNGATGQNFLTTLGHESGMLAELGSRNGLPPCADPKDLFGADNADNGTFVGDASDASNDTANTSQASGDVQATINDLAAINAELKTTAPGVHITGLAAGVKF